MAERKRLTPDEKATAVAQVLAGESRREVARRMGITETSVRRWVKEADGRETSRAQELAEKAQAIAEEIEHWQELARHALIRRIVELAPRSEDLDKVAGAYEKVTKSSLLSRGKATGRTEVIQKDSVDTEIQDLLETMARREAAGSNGSG
jgi:transposase-like protein